MEAVTHNVVGMSCEHCVASVHEEVSQVPGVRDVEVDLVSGRLVVTGEGFSENAVEAAVDEAGYGLVT
jgi:copper chaperone